MLSSLLNIQKLWRERVILWWPFTKEHDKLQVAESVVRICVHDYTKFRRRNEEKKDEEKASLSAPPNIFAVEKILTTMVEKLL